MYMGAFLNFKKDVFQLCCQAEVKVDTNIWLQEPKKSKTNKKNPNKNKPLLLENF